MSVQNKQFLVLASEDSVGGKGGLFERFVANLLADHYGFQGPTTRNLNVTSDGIELDVVASHRLTGGTAYAECKAYTRSVAAKELSNFYGKLCVERFDDTQAFGLMCVLPRLTPEGEEKARAIELRDQAFKYLDADDLAEAILQAGLIAIPPATIKDSSDLGVILTEQGLFACCISLNPVQRTPERVAVWGVDGAVPDSVVNLLSSSDYAGGLPVYDAGDLGEVEVGAKVQPQPVLLTRVVGSTSDFEYHLPASPKYFVGRGNLVERLGETLVTERGSVLVLNAQSGWGKSSLALKMGELSRKKHGVSIILDTRTADQPRYVVEVLRRLSEEAAAAGLLTLPDAPSWASLESALTTLRRAKWTRDRPVLAFFDQFENVFRDVELTRTFRDLALGVREIPGPLIVGFAWKTDLVGWTEGHPYQLRDDIRGSGNVVVVEPFGPKEVDVILSRMAKQADVRLLPDLRSRLKAYSQGLPWLLKKFADHVLRELKGGETQEGLLAESLNVVALFEGDLAELTPSEHTVIRHVARFAPILASEVTERYGPDSVQSLVDRRLLVQVGDRLDTYWDTFRDFLNTGSVPVEESWILRQTPRSEGRLLQAVVVAGGSASVKDLVKVLGTSDRAIFNLSRELRLLGVTAHEPNRVRLNDEVLHARDREQEMRRLVGATLRKHKAYSSLRNLADRSGGQITLESYARDIPNAFPAVDVAPNSWKSYARAFLLWMEYAGLVEREGIEYRATSEPSVVPAFRLLDAATPMKYRPGVPQIAPGNALKILGRLHSDGQIDLPASGKSREAVGTLFGLGAITVSVERKVVAVDNLLQADGTVNAALLRGLLASVPGGGAGLTLLESDPGALPREVGEVVAKHAHAQWTPDTTRSIGGYFRSWAKLAGLRITRPPRSVGQSNAPTST